jgi:hypothetical protein
MIDKRQIEKVLTAIYDLSKDVVSPSDYRLVGTAAAVMHGFDLPVGDIDILLRLRQGVDAFFNSLSAFECLTSPQYLEGSMQYFAAVNVHGIKVEFSTVEFACDLTTKECIGSGPWEHYAMINCGQRSIPVVALELRLLTELFRQRVDRYQPIWQFMQRKGYNKPLLEKGLIEQNLTLKSCSY